MILTPDKLREIRGIINDHMTALALRFFGQAPLGLSDQEVDRLVRLGILDAEGVLKDDLLTDALLFGKARALIEAQGQQMPPISLSEFHREWVKGPLGPIEQAAAENARKWAGQYAVGLGQRVADAVVSLAQQEDKALEQKLAGLIKQETARTIARHEGAQKLASTLRTQSDDLARDWKRLAATEIHEAQEQGAALAIRKAFGPDAPVAKIPNRDACKHCLRLHLENGRPRVFTLSALAVNGTNVGRKPEDWKPVIGNNHPWERCRLVYVPKGWGFDEDWNLTPPEEK